MAKDRQNRTRKIKGGQFSLARVVNPLSRAVGQMRPATMKATQTMLTTPRLATNTRFPTTAFQPMRFISRTSAKVGKKVGTTNESKSKSLTHANLVRISKEKNITRAQVENAKSVNNLKKTYRDVFGEHLPYKVTMRSNVEDLFIKKLEQVKKTKEASKSDKAPTSADYKAVGEDLRNVAGGSKNDVREGVKAAAEYIRTKPSSSFTAKNMLLVEDKVKGLLKEHTILKNFQKFFIYAKDLETEHPLLNTVLHPEEYNKLNNDLMAVLTHIVKTTDKKEIDKFFSVFTEKRLYDLKRGMINYYIYSPKDAKLIFNQIFKIVALNGFTPLQLDGLIAILEQNPSAALSEVYSIYGKLSEREQELDKILPLSYLKGKGWFKARSFWQVVLFGGGVAGLFILFWHGISDPWTAKVFVQEVKRDIIQSHTYINLNNKQKLAAAESEAWGNMISVYVFNNFINPVKNIVAEPFDKLKNAYDEALDPYREKTLSQKILAALEHLKEYISGIKKE